MKIGVFDSGFGGLTVLKCLHTTLPEYDYLYLGDNARAPYGDRSPDTIYEFTRQCVDYLFSHDCALVVLACNTASAHALTRLQKEWLPLYYPDRIVIGVIDPLAAWLCSSNSHAVNVGLIGTRTTIKARAYEHAITTHCIQDKSPQLKLTTQACPLLVPLIEEGWHNSVPAIMILKKYLRPLKQTKINTLILGCTHYPLIEEKIKRIMGKNVSVINPGRIVADAISRLIEKNSPLSTILSLNNTTTFLTTDNAERFRTFATRFWGEPIEVSTIHLEK